MPAGNKEKFRTIIDKEDVYTKPARQKSVTVIRKGSKADKDFQSEKVGAEQRSLIGSKDTKYPAMFNKIKKSASEEIAAGRMTRKLKSAYNSQVTPGKWTTE